MMYVVLGMFLVGMWMTISDQARNESEQEEVKNFFRSEYRMM